MQHLLRLSQGHRPTQGGQNEQKLMHVPLAIAILLVISIIYKKDGYRQRNVRQFLHILASLSTPLGQSR